MKSNRQNSMLLWLCIFLCIPSVMRGQEVEIRTRIMDNSTHLPIAWTNLYVEGKLKCISNIDGDILTKAHATDTLLFAVAGYSEQRWMAAQAPAVITMEPLDRELREVVVLSDFAVLMNTFKKMKKEYSQYRKKASPYFNRITVQSGEQTEIVEDFLHAKSAISLRDLGLYSGHYWGKSREGDSITSYLKKIDLHKMLSTGPMMPQQSSGNSFTLPFPMNCSLSHLKKHYEISSDLLDMKGNLIYCIHLKKKGVKQSMLLTGDMYIDARSFHLLRFDGNVDVLLYIKRQEENITILERMPGDLKIHVSFREKNGFTEVSDMYDEIAASDVSIQSVLFNVEDYQFPFKKSVPVRDNLLDAIDKLRASPQLFETPNVIKRTEKEDSIIQHSMKNGGGSMPSVSLPVQASTHSLVRVLSRRRGSSIVKKTLAHRQEAGYSPTRT